MPRHRTVEGAVSRIAAASWARTMRATALALAMMSMMSPPAWSMDGAILVVSALDGPMPAPELEPKIRAALANAGVRFSAAQVVSLSRQVSRALAGPGGAFDKTFCASGQPPCITLVRE